MATEPRVARWRKRVGKRHMADLQVRYKTARRLEAIAAYGGKCVCCGESTYEFLCFDHINGDGKQDRKANGYGTAFVRYLKRNSWPKHVQLLCHNCNLAKGFYGQCPHQKKELAVA